MIARSKVTMRIVLLLLALVLGLSDAARRTTTTSATVATYGGRNREYSRQHQENAWDLVQLQKLDNRPDTWNKDPNAAMNGTGSEDSEVLNTRQLYPLIPNPGDTNELPGPILPTVQPIPSVTPPPGCYAMRGQFPSPKSCANYLNCWDEVVTEQSCPDGLLFNDVSLVCDYNYNVNCANRPLPTPKPPMPPGSKLCPKPNGSYRSATNCSEFFVCVYRKPIKFGCPRGLVYNDIVGVCDYPYNVDCKGATTPGITLPTVPPTQTQPPTQPPSLPPQQPTYPSSPPYQPQQPPYVPSPPQQPPYVPSPPQQPSYPPSQPPQQPAYPSNPWLEKAEPDPWYQRPVASQLEIDSQKHKELYGVQDPPQEIENAWALLESIPASLTRVPCNNGDMHRLSDSCTNVVVCRNGRPQLVHCPVGLTYDRPSDSCKSFSIAKC